MAAFFAPRSQAGSRLTKNKAFSMKTLLQQGVFPLLEPLGFVLEGHSLLRKKPKRWDLIAFLPGQKETFQIQLGVHYPEVLKRVLKIPSFHSLQRMATPLTPGACAWTTELGQLLNTPQRYWKVASRGPELKAQIEEITLLLLETALPWLNQRANLESLLGPPCRSDVFALVAAQLTEDRTAFDLRWPLFQKDYPEVQF